MGRVPGPEQPPSPPAWLPLPRTGDPHPGPSGPVSTRLSAALSAPRPPVSSASPAGHRTLQHGLVSSLLPSSSCHVF